MKHKIISMLLAITLVAMLLAEVVTVPTLADQNKPDQSSLQVGQEVQVDLYSKVKLNKINYDENLIPISKEYEITISSLPQVTPDGVSIDAQWYECKDITGNIYFESGNNLFTATATSNGKTFVQDSNGRLLVWTPILSVGTNFPDYNKAKLLSKDPYNENYSNNVLEWTYTLKTGLFGLSKVTILRQLRIIEGCLLEYYIVENNPGADLTVLRSGIREPGVATYIGDAVAFDSATREHYLTVENYPSGFTIQGKEFNNKTYPVIIDPPIPFTTSASDANAYKTGIGGYSTLQSSTTGVVESSATSLRVGQYFYEYNGAYWIRRAFVYFNTGSVLPENADITSATLALYGRDDYSDTDFYITIQSGMSTYPHDPVVTGDYNKAYYSGDGGSLHTSDFSSYDYNDISLSATGRGWINDSGWTKFMLRSNREILGTTPTGSEGVVVYSFEKGTGYAPKLAVTYTEPIVPPTVRTVTALDEGETSMTLRGDLDDNGGEACTVYFMYGTTTSCTQKSDELDGLSSGYFNIPITGLSRGTKYYYKAMASNGAGTTEGTIRSETTLPGEPTGLDVTPGNEQNSLTWNKGDGASNTIIRSSTSDFPSSYTDGDDVYSGTGTSTTDSSLDAGTTVYYRAWSLKNGQYSTGFDDDYGEPYYHGDPDTTTYDAVAGITTATLRGYLDALNQDGGTVSVYFQYYYGGGTWADNEVEATGSPLSASGLFSKAETGLQEDTLYHCRTKAVGTHGTGYGDDVPFTTGATCAPTITTGAATGEGLTYATLNGEVTDAGGADFEAYFIWGLSENHLIEETGHIIVAAENVPYPLHCPIDDPPLEPDTEYFFQAVAENTAGFTGWGDIESFTTTEPSEPAVVTNDAPIVGANTATIAGTLTGDGGVECEVRFEYDVDSSAPYAEYTGWQDGKWSGQSFTALLSGLNVSQTIYYRASAKNAGGTVYGGEKSFTTVFSPPEEFAAKSIGANTISLTWQKQGDRTYIYYKTTGYPVARHDGSLAYSGDGNSATHDTLDPGVTYFYRAWSWRTGDVWSETYSEDAATTGGVMTEEEQEFYHPDPPDPGAMFQELGIEKLANFPGYDMINTAADELGMPQPMFWLLITMGLFITLGLIFYIPTENVMLALILVGAGMLVCTWLSLMPSWMILIYAVLAIGGTQLFSGQRG